MPLQLSQDCIRKWRLEEFDQLIVDFNDRVADAVNDTKIEFAKDYINIILNTAGKSLLVMREILFLSAAGYPDGALGLSRNLYEQLIILVFFEQEKGNKDFEFFVSDYYLDYEKKRLNDNRYEFLLNNKNAIPVDIKDKFDDIMKSAHSKLRRDYWWTGKPSFHKLIEYVMSNVKDEDFHGFLSHLHIAYKRACTSLHASCRGNILRLKGVFEPSLIDTSPTDETQYFPLWFATSALIGIVGITCTTLGISHKPILGKLNELALFYKKYKYQEREE